MRRAFNGNYGITRVFGVYDAAYANYPGSKHPGTDYGLPANTQLVAGMAGHVTVFDRDASIKVGRGKEVVIAFGNHLRKACHLNRIDVQPGQWVDEGQPIGLSGHTGYVLDAQGKVGTPGGAHLHDELLVDGQYVSLEWYLTTQGDEDMVTAEEVDLAFQAGFNQRATAQEIKELTGKSTKHLLQHVLKYNLPLRTKAANFDNYAGALQNANAQIDALRRQLADTQVINDEKVNKVLVAIKEAFK